MGDLVLLFCNKIKVAVMTFDDQYFIEFCFDKYNNTVLDRLEIQNTIKYVTMSLEKVDKMDIIVALI